MKKIPDLLRAAVLLGLSLVVSACATHPAANTLPSNGENLEIRPPAGWRLSYTTGDPESNYLVEFMPNSEDHDSWREGYMSVQRGAYTPIAGQHLATQAVSGLIQAAQTKCAGHFSAMQQKETQTNGAYTTIGGGFCERYSSVAPYGEGSLTAVIEGKKNLFLVQFGWRPATENDLKDYNWRIKPERLQQYLNLLNQATLCGGPSEIPCPH